jgi:hypothetical protein
MKTTLGQAGSPQDPRDYDVAYSKNAPLNQQVKEWLAHAAGELAPIPVLHFAFAQGIQRGISPREMQEKVEAGAVGAFIQDALTHEQNEKLNSVMGYWNWQVTTMPKNLSWDERQRRLERFYTIYTNKVKNILYHTDRVPNFWSSESSGAGF